MTDVSRLRKRQAPPRPRPTPRSRRAPARRNRAPRRGNRTRARAGTARAAARRAGSSPTNKDETSQRPGDGVDAGGVDQGRYLGLRTCFCGNGAGVHRGRGFERTLQARDVDGGISEPGDFEQVLEALRAPERVGALQQLEQCLRRSRVRGAQRRPAAARQERQLALFARRPQALAKSATRRIRTGSSAKARLTWRSTPSFKSRRPPNGSISVPSSAFAMALIVRSRRFRSSSSVTSGAACTVKPL